MALGLCLGAPAALADEEVEFHNLPEKVQDTVKVIVGEGEIDEIEKEKKDGKVVCEVEYESDDGEWELKVSEDGRLLEKSED